MNKLYLCPSLRWAFLLFIYSGVTEGYKPSREEKDKKRNLNGEITKTKIPRFNDYDEAMNFRNNYKENEKGGK